MSHSFIKEHVCVWWWYVLMVVLVMVVLPPSAAQYSPSTPQNRDPGPMSSSTSRTALLPTGGRATGLVEPGSLPLLARHLLQPVLATSTVR